MNRMKLTRKQLHYRSRSRVIRKRDEQRLKQDFESSQMKLLETRSDLAALDACTVRIGFEYARYPEPTHGLTVRIWPQQLQMMYRSEFESPSGYVRGIAEDVARKVERLLYEKLRET